MSDANHIGDRDELVVGDNDHGDAISKCGSCGVAWVDHIGIMGVCAEVAQLRAERDALLKQRFEVDEREENLRLKIESAWRSERDEAIQQRDEAIRERDEARRFEVDEREEEGERMSKPDQKCKKCGCLLSNHCSEEWSCADRQDLMEVLMDARNARQAARDDRDEAREERDEAREERNQAREERDQARAEADEAIDERDEARADLRDHIHKMRSAEETP